MKKITKIKVVHGNKEASKLGFPTANLDISIADINIDDGIYASEVFIDDHRYIGALVVMSNIPKVEVHKIDFNGILYGRFLDITINALVSDIQDFIDVEQMKLKISDDVLKVKKYFK